MVSKNFSRKEFACRCGCGFDDVDDELVQVLEHLREVLGNTPVTITSGCRCTAHNRKVGGAPKSKHILGVAADIKVKGVKPNRVADTLEDLYPDRYGIGRYRGWVHIDVRTKRARW